jgi:hypothetical protein
MSDLENGRVEVGAEMDAPEVPEMEVREMAERQMDERQLDDRSVDETLRMIARVPVPDGLEERVKAGLRLEGNSRRVLSWPAQRRGETVWVANAWMRGAAAAGIAMAVVGGGWGIYARVAPPQSAKTVAAPLVQPSGTFSEAGAIRRPQTVTGPTVKPLAQLDSKKDGEAKSAGFAGTARTRKQISGNKANALAN